MDTQNNAAGGYPYCGNASTVGDTDGLELYVGSMLRIEWTVQHSCGPDADALCTVVLQYACDDTMPHIRDGYPSGDVVQSDGANPGYFKAEFQDTKQNNDGTNRIPCPSSVSGCSGSFGDALDTDEDLYMAFFNGEDTSTPEHHGIEFGYHESFEYYRDQCLNTRRNEKLYTADQTLNGLRARRTRQNPSGARSGLECPEERDYYPWWQPSPWKDIAVLVTDDSWCEFYQQESFNVKSRYKCVMTESERLAADDGLLPIFKDECESQEGVWTEVPSHGIAAPECDTHPYSRDNHLGNSVSVDDDGNIKAESPKMAHYDWKLPKDVEDKSCIIRLRYNISGVDYPSMNTFKTEFDEEIDGTFWDWRYNCEAVTTTSTDLDDAEATIDVDQNEQCSGILTDDTVPLYNRPRVSVFDEYPSLPIAFNTNQVGRTFQDRSFVFRALSRPDGVSDDATIWNLGYRGRRGNIVQAYPAVEYDFVPTNLSVSETDYVHIQFCGSDFNPARNPNNGEGWQYSDRTNMVQTRTLQTQFPLPAESMTLFSEEDSIRFAFSGIPDADLKDPEVCHSFPNDEDSDNDNTVYNCGVLNPAPARFNGGLVKFLAGTYHYVSTRNNNFSNRSQKGSIVVSSSGLSAAEAAAIAVGVVSFVGLVLGGSLWCIKKRPESTFAGIFKGKGTLTGPV